MNSEPRIDPANLAFGLWAVTLVLFFGLRAAVSGPGDIAGPFGLSAAFVVGGPSKLLAFVLAATFAVRSGIALGEGTPTRGAWVGLGLGFACFGVAQAILVVHQLVIPGDTPYPNPADAAFLVGYTILIAALVGFVREYAASGMLGLGGRELGLTAIAGSAGAIVYLVPVELRILAYDEPWLLKGVGAAYPLLDAALLVLALVLLRIVMRLRGSQFARPWRLLLAGFATFTVGDTLYAVSVAELWVLDPLLDTSFAVGYLMCAWGCWSQFEQLR